MNPPISKVDLDILRLRLQDVLWRLSEEFHIRIRLGRFSPNKNGFHSTLEGGGPLKARRKK